MACYAQAAMRRPGHRPGTAAATAIHTLRVGVSTMAAIAHSSLLGRGLMAELLVTTGYFTSVALAMTLHALRLRS